MSPTSGAKQTDLWCCWGHACFAVSAGLGTGGHLVGNGVWWEKFRGLRIWTCPGLFERKGAGPARTTRAWVRRRGRTGTEKPSPQAFSFELIPSEPQSFRYSGTAQPVKNAATLLAKIRSSDALGGGISDYGFLALATRRMWIKEIKRLRNGNSWACVLRSKPL